MTVSKFDYLKRREIMNIKYMKIIVSLLLILCLCGITNAGTEDKQSGKTGLSDDTEGGHQDTDFNSGFMSEWWYQNGDMRLVAEDGEKKNVAFFAVMAHQESPTVFNDTAGVQHSELATFYGLYPYGETPAHDYTKKRVPRAEIENYVTLHVPYLDFIYPDDYGRFSGSSSEGYKLDYKYGDVQFDVLFKPSIGKTIDRAVEPVNFTTYERAYGNLEGNVVLDGKKYKITQADGYFDHMIPYATDQMVWGMEMHGWSWSEVTTDKYQTIFYGVRGIDDGYKDYTYKHLTLLNKNTGKLIAEYSGDDVTIDEAGWTPVTIKERKVSRPAQIKIAAPDVEILINSQSVVQLDKSSLPDNSPAGFVDFMAFQPETATIAYKNNLEKGSAFYEYMVTDWGIITSSGQEP
jgi:hypothetical protein